MNKSSNPIDSLIYRFPSPIIVSDNHFAKVCFLIHQCLISFIIIGRYSIVIILSTLIHLFVAFPLNLIIFNFIQTLLDSV